MLSKIVINQDQESNKQSGKLRNIQGVVTLRIVGSAWKIDLHKMENRDWSFMLAVLTLRKVDTANRRHFSHPELKHPVALEIECWWYWK